MSLSTNNLTTDIATQLIALGDPVKALKATRYFKIQPGDYAYGDQFLGISSPTLRNIVKDSMSLPLSTCESLLCSKWHEIRLFALYLLVAKYQKGDLKLRQAIYSLYFKHSRYINNWDLVDSSVYQIVGTHLLDKDKSILRKLALSNNLWERRIAIVATFQFIRHFQFAETLEIALILLEDNEDLIHKAVGWMLRELGKRDKSLLDRFLTQHYPQMPRTMLRYAIEKHTPSQRQGFLQGTVQVKKLLSY